jgi:hypothetical protein
MPGRVRLVFTILNLSVFLLAALPIIRELARPDDIWWTPRTMLVPLAESANRVEIYAHGRPLAGLLQAGQVQVLEGGGPVTLAPSDVGFRFNNSDHVRAERLPMLLLSAAVCGAIAVFGLLLVTGRLAYRGDRAA